MCPFEARGGAATGPTSKLGLAAGRPDRAPVFCRKPENQRWGLGGQQQAAQTARAAGGRLRYSSLCLAARWYHPAARRAHGHPQATPKHHSSPSITGRRPAPSCSTGMPQLLPILTQTRAIPIWLPFQNGAGAEATKEKEASGEWHKQLCAHSPSAGARQGRGSSPHGVRGALSWMEQGRVLGGRGKAAGVLTGALICRGRQHARGWQSW